MTVPGEPRPTESSASLSIGDVVSERYRIDAVLGEGGMGVVYRAEHLHLHKPLALKVLLPLWSSTPEVVARFEREAVAAGRIESPHVVAATDFGTLPDGSFFLVMEYVSGRTLRTVLDAGALEPGRALRLLRGIASALHAAHTLGIVHRDVKPENVMLVERDGDPDFVKVLDFGIAKIDGLVGPDPGRASDPLTRVGAVIGTPDYMSPEQAQGQAIDARSDLYSAGVILFEMLTGRCPYEGGAVTVLQQHVTAAVPELPPALLATLEPGVGDILARLLAKAPDGRFPGAAELVAALDEMAPAQTPPPEPARIRLWPIEPRLRLAVAAAAASVLIAILVALLADRQTPASTPGAASAADTTALVVPSSVPAGPADTGPAPVLPPPPAPSSATEPGKPATAPQGGSRQTGPGGIYIPPPSRWFK